MPFPDTSIRLLSGLALATTLACAENSSSLCEQAADLVASCSDSAEVEPPTECSTEQEEAARGVLDSGCAGIESGKADGLFCVSFLKFLGLCDLDNAVSSGEANEIYIARIWERLPEGRYAGKTEDDEACTISVDQDDFLGPYVSVNGWLDADVDEDGSVWPFYNFQLTRQSSNYVVSFEESDDRLQVVRMRDDEMQFQVDPLDRLTIESVDDTLIIEVRDLRKKEGIICIVDPTPTPHEDQ